MALSGAAALIYEIVASQALLNFFSANTYSIATVLTSFLFGLSIGSLTMSKLLPRIKNKKLAFIIIELLIASYATLFLTKFNVLPSYIINSQISGFTLTMTKFIISFIYLLIPTLLLGALFPLASSLLIKKIKKAGSIVGLLYSFDTFGAILGAFLAGFILIPIFGLIKSALFGSVLSFFAGLLMIEKHWKKLLIYTVSYAIIFSLFIVLTPETKTLIEDQDSYITNNENILFEKSTSYGTVSIINKNKEPSLYISNRYQCGKNYNTGKQIIEPILDPEKKDILLIGLGCGISLSKALEFSTVESIDVVEINPLIPALTKKYFSNINNNALSNPKVNLIIEDGAQYLSQTNKKYDLIVIDLENPVVAHSSPLYTVEYFKKASYLLNDNGILSLQGYNGDFEYQKTLYFSLKEAFPHVYIKKYHNNYIGSKKLLNIDLNHESLEILKNLNKETSYQLNTLDHQILLKYVIDNKANLDLI